MLSRYLKKFLRLFGFQLQRINPASSRPEEEGPAAGLPAPPAVEPVWPLPRRPGGLSDEAIRQEFAKHDQWHYPYKFAGDLTFSSRHSEPGSLSEETDRVTQRFRHFMPYVIDSQGGSLEGKQVLDIACNSGFWSIQCALLGANVTAFDARAELIEQANLIKSIVGVDNVDFQVLDFWKMSPERLGTFDVVLCLGILYHLPKPLEALELIASMAQGHVLVDTQISPSQDSIVKLYWEESDDIRSASNAGVVAYPSKSAMDLLLRHIGVADWFEIPLRSADMPSDYRLHRRASWLIKV
jgi:2-polyprenyl-3-methyl-5-hydroxy-6-metoxy-1,4-benzoquinol methylase